MVGSKTVVIGEPFDTTDMPRWYSLQPGYASIPCMPVLPLRAAVFLDTATISAGATIWRAGMALQCCRREEGLPPEGRFPPFGKIMGIYGSLDSSASVTGFPLYSLVSGFPMRCPMGLQGQT